MSLVAIAPVIDNLISKADDIVTILWKIEHIRANPYPPNFRRIAARTIDPAIGASTWALGSHRWVENIGSFTKNPIRVISQNNELYEKNFGNKSSVGIDINKWFEFM